jgi:hypothetical protein
MTEAEDKRQARLKLLKRLIPLAVLGAVVALVVGQITRMITYDVVLTTTMTPGLADGLSGIELTVYTADQEAEIQSVTVFRVDETIQRERKFDHTLHLTSGKYLLSFKFIASGDSARAKMERTLEVSGDAAVSINLP